MYYYYYDKDNDGGDDDDEFSLGGSSPYTSRDNTNKNKIFMNDTVQKHNTNNTKHSKYKYTYYQNTHIIVQTPTHYTTHTLQNKLKQAQYNIHTTRNSHNIFKYPQYRVTLMYMVLFSPRTSP